ncbi:MAG: inorganic diphosphatase [Candidatus Eremiobacteraeota bacterium]|nr:inorganic diphosphatase [Candidatus Eremiobacteraeota bacterium]
MSINPTHFENIPAYADSAGSHGKERLVNAVIESPRDTRHKYAYVPKLGIFRLKMVLAEGLEWPYDYGFVPQTLADDGDPLNILVMNAIPTFAGCLVECRILGLVRLAKDGTRNDRVIAAPLFCPGSPQPTDPFDDVDDIPKDTIESIKRFLSEYSEEEGHHIEIRGVKSKKRAFEAIDEAIEAYKNSKKG